MSLSIIILAAGQGTRMHSDLPKILHPLAGKSLLEHVYVASSRLDAGATYVVYGHGGERVLEELAHLQVNWVEQAQQLGTGHAVQQVIDTIADGDDVLILYADVPLIAYQTLENLVQAAAATGFGLLTSYIDDPKGLGRIVRDGKGDILRIVEEKDANEDERDIREINSGMMVVRSRLLKKYLDQLQDNNAQGEYYLTDIVAMAVAEDIVINSINPDSVFEIKGVNSRAQLAELERYYQLLQAHHLMLNGVSLADPARFDLRGDMETGRDISIDINVIIEGSVCIGNNVTIGPNCVIRDADIGDNVNILANCVIENAVIGNNCRLGPFSRIRPETRLAQDVHIGNFVEIKKSEIADGSKINHLSYIGDSEIGRNVNIGAGTITCNYDGANKHKTIIGDDVFVGSNTQLVAPVKIGNGASIGAGTTVTKNVEAEMLALSRTAQRSIKGWKRPTKK